MILELTEHERKALHEVLIQTLQSLPIEIHRTDSIDYRKSLEQAESVLRNIERRLGNQVLVEH